MYGTRSGAVHETLGSFTFVALGMFPAGMRVSHNVMDETLAVG